MKKHNTKITIKYKIIYKNGIFQDKILSIKVEHDYHDGYGYGLDLSCEARDNGDICGHMVFKIIQTFKDKSANVIVKYEEVE